MSKSINIAITDSAPNNGWKNLSTLVQAAFATLNKSAPRNRANAIELTNTTYASPDSRLQFTHDPTNTNPLTKGLLPEEQKIFAETGAINGQSMYDIWVRMTATDGTTLIAGTATVRLEIG